MTSRILRMRDLKARGIVHSWPALKRKVARDAFPPGFMIGPNSRAWLESEVDAWIASRPTGGPTPRGIALANIHKARAKAGKQRAAAEEAARSSESS